MKLFKKLIIVSLILIFGVQTVFANYAFDKKVVNTCRSYRIKVNPTDLSRLGDEYLIALKSNRNNFEMVMLVGFAAAGQAIKHQYSMQKSRKDYKPDVPNTILVTVEVPVDRNPMFISGSASSGLVMKLADGLISATDFMQAIKETIETQ